MEQTIEHVQMKSTYVRYTYVYCVTASGWMLKMKWLPGARKHRVLA